MPELYSAVSGSVPQYSDIPSSAYVILQLPSSAIIPGGFPYVFGHSRVAAMLVCVCARACMRFLREDGRTMAALGSRPASVLALG